MGTVYQRFRVYICAGTFGFAAWLGTAIPVIAQPDGMRNLNPRMLPALQIDQQRVRAAGVHKLSGKYIDLYTDVRDEPKINELVQVYDAAVPAWAEFFGVANEKIQVYRISGIVIQKGNEQRVRDAGLLPDDLPDFAAGFNRGHEFWIYSQPGDYYTRHLMLHEGTHAFMQWMLGGSGPPWYSEGMAELLAVHSWQNGELTLALERSTRKDTPYWGRPKIIREDVECGKARSLENVFATPNINFRQVRYYAWSWAACRFLSNHPASKETFREMANHSHDVTERFNVRLRNKLKPVREQLDRDWQLYIGEMEYGYDVAAAAVSRAQNTGEQMYRVDATRGWQETDINLKTGQTVRLDASGRVQLRETSKPWISEPGGITIEYYRGQPLGRLLAGVQVGESDDCIRTLSAGKSGDYQIPADGKLLLRVNESPAELHDNRAHFDVTVSISK